MFSYHPDTDHIGQWSKYSQGWLSVGEAQLANIICQCMTSPIIFKGGKRAKVNFLSARSLVLDFDEGPSLESIKEAFAPFSHLIGTTKSHRLPKSGHPPCDRFRLWVSLSREITDAASYEATTRHYAKLYAADLNAVDAARIFKPCKEIIAIGKNFKTLDPIVFLVRDPPKVDRKDFAGKIPPWVENWLNGQLDPSGGRNRHIFKTTLWLTKNGFAENEITSLVMGSALVCEMSEAEVLKAIRSGRNHSQKTR